MHRSMARHLTSTASLVLGCLVLVAGFPCPAAAGPAPANGPAINTFREIRCFSGHTDAVWGAAVSADGRRALSGSYDRSVRLWDVLTGKELLKLADFPAAVMAVAFLPDGQSCVASCSDGSVHFCDLKLGKRVRQIQAHNGSANGLDVSKDGKLLATGGADGTVKIWDCATGTEKQALAGSTDWIWSVAFSPDGKQVLAGGADKAARLWDIESGKELVQLNSHKDSINAVAFSADGKRALTGSNDGEVRLWGLDKGHVIRQMTGPKTPVYSVLFSREGRHAFAAGADGIIRTWEITQQDAQSSGLAMRGRGRTAMVMDPYGNPISAEAGKETRRYEGHDGAVYHLALSPDGQQLLSAGRDGTLRLWETRGLDTEVHDFAHPGPVHVAAFTHNGDRLATLSAGVIRGWNIDQGTLYRQTPLFGRVVSNRNPDLQAGNENTRLQTFLFQTRVLPAGNQMAALTTNGLLAVWNGDNSLAPKTLELSKGKAQFHAAVFTSDGKEVITGDAEGRVIAWDLQTGKELRSVNFPGKVVWNLTISSNDRDLLALTFPAQGQNKGADQVIRRLDRRSLKETGTYHARQGLVTALAFAPAGASFLSGNSDGTVTWRELTPKGKTKVFNIPGGGVTAVAFINNEQFVSAGRDRALRLWGLADGKELQRWDGHRELITGLTYSASKNLLLSASNDHSVRIWKIGTSDQNLRAESTRAEPRKQSVAKPK
jgi:WD40 repeat protein